MKMDRRTFLLGTGAFIAAPALAGVQALRDDRWGSPLAPSAVAPSDELVFRIDGWNPRESAKGDDLWLAVDRSWRIAWR